MSEFGERLSRLRKSRGFSGEALASATGGALTRNMIANLETGRKTLTVDDLILLAAILRVSAYELVPELDPARAQRDAGLQRIADELIGAFNV